MPCKLSYDIRCLSLLHTCQMPNHNRASLCYADSIEIYEHHHVSNIDTSRESLITYHVNEIDNGKLLKIIGDILTGRRQSDFEELSHLGERERTEQSQWETWNEFTVKHHDKHEHRYRTRDTCWDSSTLCSKSRHTELTEDKRIVADDIQDIYHHNHHHRVNRLIWCSENSAYGCGYGLCKGKRTYNL